MKNLALSGQAVGLRVKKSLVWGWGAMAGVAAAPALPVHALTYDPGPVEPMAVRGATNGPVLRPGEKLRILNGNVRHMAGKNHHFKCEGGLDPRPSSGEIGATLAEVAPVIRGAGRSFLASLLQWREPGHSTNASE